MSTHQSLQKTQTLCDTANIMSLKDLEKPSYSFVLEDMQAYQPLVETRTKTLIDTYTKLNSSDRAKTSPNQLREAMIYGAEGGKKIRAYLIKLTAELAGLDPATALDLGCALEMVHAYSLIHDDLPAMDNADMRRGKPAAFHAFGEATAILAGTALLTLAYEVILGLDLTPAQKLTLIKDLSFALGACGMMGGQFYDIDAESSPQNYATQEAVEHIEALKTGALFQFALLSPLKITNSSAQTLKAFQNYAAHFGILFQITDDLLDYEGDTFEMGKPTRHDQNHSKTTFLSLYGHKHTQLLAREHAKCAQTTIAFLGEKAKKLDTLINFLLERKS